MMYIVHAQVGRAQMREIGQKDRIIGKEFLERMKINGRPTYKPRLKSTHKIFCGIDFGNGKGEILFVCYSFEDMRNLYRSFIHREAKCINWYHGPYPHKVKPKHRGL